ncbi:MAG: molybdopterin synthase sulfur carrier subunit [Spirochaetae bacterium HGW-Spirochaetae-7]|jgi:sulfur carrier protein ThiS|nr:MAG: molybdopterin synthase sulfur carrier subunit [Spirochaetae bacterium HGW-Spirochaetae-7]
MSINIQLRLFASLQKWSPDPSVSIELSASSTARNAYLGIGVPDAEVAIIMINGKRGLPDDILSDGDKVQLFPFIGGG